jgi:hypothetical protein
LPNIRAQSEGGQENHGQANCGQGNGLPIRAASNTTRALSLWPILKLTQNTPQRACKKRGAENDEEDLDRGDCLAGFQQRVIDGRRLG